MKEVKFDTPFLQEYFKGKFFDKEEFSIEDLKRIYVHIDGQNANITQHDLDILLQLEKVDLRNIDFSGLTIRNGGIRSLSLHNCNLQECNIEDCEIESLSISQCQISDDFINQLKSLRGLKEFGLEGKTEFNKDKILREHPNFNELSMEERYEILSSGENLIPQRIDISGISELQGLEKLKLNQIEINNQMISGFGKLKKLTTMVIGADSSIEAGTVMPNIEALQHLDVTNLSDLRFIQNLTGIKELELYQYSGFHAKNMHILRAFSELTNLNVSGIQDIVENLPDAKKLTKLNLTVCNISSISFIDMFPDLTRVTLNGNNLGESSLEDLRKLRGRVRSLDFAGNPIALVLESQKLKIEDPEIIKEIGVILGRYKYDSDERISQYDLFSAELGDVERVQSKKTLETMVRTGIISLFQNVEIEFDLEDLEDLSPEAIKFITERENAKIELQCCRGVSCETLEQLGKKRYFVREDLYTQKFNNTYYDKDELGEILSVLQTIKSSIPEDATELQKFMAVYKAIGTIADYDDSGCRGNENCTHESRVATRSLKGVLLEGRAVCVGYSLALAHALQYVGIDARCVHGYVYGDQTLGHAWNQVKIDGRFYNTDLTWDYKDFREGEELKHCLRSDDEFYKDHEPYEHKDCEECKIDYPRDKIEEEQRALTTELDEYSKRVSSHSVSLESYKKNAHSTIISRKIIDQIKRIAKNITNKIGTRNARHNKDSECEK